MGAMPCVDLCLQFVPLCEQGPVLWDKLGEDSGEALPQLVRRYAGTFNGTAFHEMRQFLCDLQACAGYILSHFWLQCEHWCPGRVLLLATP